MTDRVTAEKKALRAEIRERRQNMTSLEREHATAAMTEHLKNLVAARGVKKLSCYLSTPTEPETRPFLKWAWDNEIDVLLPICRDDGLLEWAVANGNDDENVGMYGIPEPTGEVLGPIAINDVDLIVIPASAVDRSGMRMGWGRGYFDKTLGSMDHRPPVYAMIFDDEFVESVPTEVHDQPVTGVITPSELKTF